MKLKYIKTFETFSAEDEKVPSAGVNADMNDFNNAENQIKDFNSRKSALLTIYKTYKEDDKKSSSIPIDLYNKLLSAKFIESGDKNKIQFLNPLFTIYSEICEKTRELSNLNGTLANKKKEITDKQKAISDKSIDTETANKDIQNLNKDMSDITKNLSEINKTISDLQKNSTDQLNKINKNLQDSKKRIDNLDKK